MTAWYAVTKDVQQCTCLYLSYGCLKNINANHTVTKPRPITTEQNNARTLHC